MQEILLIHPDSGVRDQCRQIFGKYTIQYTKDLEGASSFLATQKFALIIGKYKPNDRAYSLDKLPEFISREIYRPFISEELFGEGGIKKRKFILRENLKTPVISLLDADMDLNVSGSALKKAQVTLGYQYYQDDLGNKNQLPELQEKVEQLVKRQSIEK